MTFIVLKNGKPVENSESLVYLCNKYGFKLNDFRKSAGYMTKGVKVEIVDDTKQAIKFDFLCRELVLKLRNADDGMKMVKRYIKELEENDRNRI